MCLTLRLASPDSLLQLITMVRAYHEFEDIHMTEQERKKALSHLLAHTSLGGIWLILKDAQVAGYIALTYGYSLEFGGRDAFIDEFYICPDFRGEGLGQTTLGLIQQEAERLGIRALHLEVARTNLRAQRLYARANFQPRNKYVLMSATLGSPALE
ncbi:MAG: GNAT family N-acetyltransferase [Cyanobacteria bacterium P01_A01_bin.15]